MNHQTEKTKQVFTNRTLNMRKIQAIGFDMDHTLIRYNIEEFEKTTYYFLIKKLVDEKKYPSCILDLKFNFKQAIRGLILDTKRGNILKSSRYRSIRIIYSGTQNIQYNNREKIYPGDYIDFGINHPDFFFVESHFDISSAIAYMQLIDLKKTNQQLPEYRQIFSDIEETMELIHNNHIIKDEVQKTPEKYIIPDPLVAEKLETFVQHEKKLFLLTNSHIQYCSFLMNYTINPFLKKYSRWEELFEYIITSAQKPNFFHEEKEFEQLDKTTFKQLSSSKHPIKGINQYGNAVGITEALHLKENEILYIGDQVYTDVVLLKQKCGWRTALVIEELAREIQIIQNNHLFYKEIQHLMNQKTPIGDRIDQLFSDQIENNHKQHAQTIQSLLKDLENIDQKLAKKIRKIDQQFNPFWGELMRVGVEESLFASQAERFSCIYMPYLINFLSLSPRTYYRSNKRLFPHEMK